MVISLLFILFIFGELVGMFGIVIFLVGLDVMSFVMIGVGIWFLII